MKKLLSFLALSALLTACTGGENLQGRFGAPSDKWEMALAFESPSGAREVSTSDDVLLFEMTLGQKNTLDIGSQFTVYFQTSNGLDPLGDGTLVNLVVDGSVVGSGEFTLVDPTVPNEGSALITTTKEVNLKAGKETLFTVSTDTKALFSDEVDGVTVQVEYNGKNVKGSMLRY